MYLPIPVAGAGMVIFEIEQIILRLEELFGINVEEEAA